MPLALASAYLEPNSFVSCWRRLEKARSPLTTILGFFLLGIIPLTDAWYNAVNSAILFVNLDPDQDDLRTGGLKMWRLNERTRVIAPRSDILLRLPPRNYCPHVPTAKQLAFLVCPRVEAFFGGAAGPGKTEGLLMGALQLVDLPNYHALILRRTFRQLNQTNSIM